MARNVSPLLRAAGYDAQILWPRYTPGGGVNSGSEMPYGPSGTLQENLTSLIDRSNPGPKVACRTKNGKTVHWTAAQIRTMGGMLAPGEADRCLRTVSNPYAKGKGKFVRTAADADKAQEEWSERLYEASMDKFMMGDSEPLDAVRKKYPKPAQKFSQVPVHANPKVGRTRIAKRAGISPSGSRINPGDPIVCTARGWEPA